jgi:hypothetical protein
VDEQLFLSRRRCSARPRGTDLCLGGVLVLALVPIKLFLKVCLSIFSSPQRAHRNREFLRTRRADSDGRSRAEPLEYPQDTLRHWKAVLLRIPASLAPDRSADFHREHSAYAA